MRYQDKVAIVTGAASGIGKATVQRLAREGATLILGDVNEDGARAVAEALDAEAKPLAIGFDAGDPASCRAFIAEAVQASGRIDMLCNVAGIMDWGPLAQFSEDRWERMMRVNLSSHAPASADKSPTTIPATRRKGVAAAARRAGLRAFR